MVRRRSVCTVASTTPPRREGHSSSTPKFRCWCSPNARPRCRGSRHRRCSGRPTCRFRRARCSWADRAASNRPGSPAAAMCRGWAPRCRHRCRTTHSCRPNRHRSDRSNPHRLRRRSRRSAGTPPDARDSCNPRARWGVPTSGEVRSRRWRGCPNPMHHRCGCSRTTRSSASRTRSLRRLHTRAGTSSWAVRRCRCRRN